MSLRGRLAQLGIIVDQERVEFNGGLVGGHTVFGDSYYVDYRNGDDSRSGKRRNKPVKTLAAAINSVTNNNNDIIWIDGDSTVVETAMVSLSKSRVHIVGVNGPPGKYGAGAKVSCALSTGATNIATFQNTGVRNTVTGVKFINSNTVAQGLYGVVEAGEYTRYFNCEFYKDTDLNEGGAAELVMNGDSSQFYGCTFGSLANAIVGAIARPCVLLTRELVAGKVCRDGLFEDCIFWRKCADVANLFVYWTAANDIERMLQFRDCEFWNAKLAAAVPAQVIGSSIAPTEGQVLVKGCTAMNCATAISTTTGVFVDGYTPSGQGATIGIAIQAS